MVNRFPPIIMTDKWKLSPTGEQSLWLSNTVQEFRRLVRGLVGVIYTHWPVIGCLPSEQQIGAVERLVHATQLHPSPRYTYFGQRFYKFPSYYRRGAIGWAIGQVSSFVTRYAEWQAGTRTRKDAKPPRLNADTGTYPPLYKGQCIKFSDGYQTAEIKVFTGTDWVWAQMPVTGHRERHLVDSNKRLSPLLVVKPGVCQLSVPFECHPVKRQPDKNVVAVDLGINTTATVSVVT
jgi:putative transposase